MNVSRQLLNETVPIVAVGTSDQSIDALEKLFGALPSKSGIAFFVVPAASARLDVVGRLAEVASIPVRTLAETCPLQGDTILVVPGDRIATIEGRTVTALPLGPMDGRHNAHPIDRFLCHLAEARGRGAIGVILDATGADGPIGLRHISLHGGVSLVERSGAQASAGGIRADFTLQCDSLAQTVVTLSRHRETLEAEIGSDRLFRQITARIDDVLDTATQEKRFDFRSYKTAALVRRVARRMSLHSLSEVAGYLALLDRSEGERRALIADFLMASAQLFRDPEGFEALATHVMRPLLESDREMFRIWVAGCATGEDVYSIAMLAREISDQAGDLRPWRIFGTDIDTGALRRARRGVFEESAIKHLSTDRIARHFVVKGETITIAEPLRSMCVFAPHGLLQDPPFSKLDVISCRNVLAYLNEAAQSDLLREFHYGLNGGGVLWVGDSEGPRVSPDLFDELDRDACLFRRNDSRSFSLPGYAQAVPRGQVRRTPMTAGHAPAAPVAPLSQSDTLRAEIQRTLATDLAPPYLAIGGSGDIVYLSDGAARLTRPDAGTTGASIETLFPADLREPLRGLVTRARRESGPIALENVAFGETTIDLHAAVSRGASDVVVVTFLPAAARDTIAPVDDATRALALSRRQLASLQLEYETIDQELRATNQKLLRANDGLQTSNEELETSREELQSLNDQLETVNAELSETNRRITEAHEDLANLFDATDIATLFLDDRHRVRRFTPALKRLFRIRSRDANRSIDELATVLDYPQLTSDASLVCRNGKPVAREVSTRDGDATFAAELRPYRTEKSGVSGVVVSFLDITDRKHSADRLAKAADRMARQYGELEGLYDAIPLGLSLIDRDHRWLRVNKKLQEINGVSMHDSIGQDARRKLADVQAQIAPIVDQVFETEEPVTGVRISGETPAHPGETREWRVDYFPVHGNDGVFAVGTVVRDVTKELDLERRLDVSEARLQRIFNRMPASVSMHRGPEHDCMYLNSRYSATLRALDPPSTRVLDAWSGVQDDVLAAMNEAYDTGETVSMTDIRIPGPDGDEQVSSISILPWHDADGEIAGVLTFALDTTDEAVARQAAEDERQRLRRLRDSLGVFIGLLDTDGKLIEVNATVIDQSAITREDVIDRPFWECYWWTFDSDVSAGVKDGFERALEGEFIRYDTQVRLSDDRLSYIDFQMVPVLNEAGHVIEVVPSAIDISDRMKAEERKDVLLAELEHRVKNVLATVQAVARFTARSTDSKDDFENALIARLAAISRTHDTLTAQGWEGEGLRALIESETSFFGDGSVDCVTIEGDDVFLSPSDAMAMGLALHELATNAAKYGAFSVESGRLSIMIVATDGRLVSLEWRETGVPPSCRERKSGFGTYLLTNVLTRELDMGITLDFADDGLICRIHAGAEHA